MSMGEGVDRVLRMAEDFAFAAGSASVRMEHLCAGLLFDHDALDVVVAAGWYDFVTGIVSPLPMPRCRAMPMARSAQVRQMVSRAADLALAEPDSGTALPCHLASAVIETLAEEQPEAPAANRAQMQKRVETQVAARRGPSQNLRRSAYHEAGHAVVMAIGGVLPSEVRVGEGPTAMANVTFAPETWMCGSVTLSEACQWLRIAMAGRAAERLAFGEASTGSETDMATAKRIARVMLGMWPEGAWHDPVRPTRADLTGRPARVCSPRRAKRSVGHLLGRAEAEARETLIAHRGLLDRLAQELLKRSVMYRADLIGILGGHASGATPASRPT